MIRIILLALFAVGASTYAILQTWEVTERDATISRLNRELAEMRDIASKSAAEAESTRAKMAGLQENVARLTAERDEARKNTAATPTVVAAATPAAPAAETPTPAGGMKAFAQIFASEDGKKMMKANLQMMTKMQYADLAKNLKLSPKDSEQLMTLLSERQGALAEHSFKAMADGVIGPEQAAALEGGTAALKKEYDDKIRGMVGEEQFSKVKDYEKTLGDRMMLTQFDHQFSAAGAPLQGAQREQLLNIMAEERRKSPPLVFDTTGQNPGQGLSMLQDDAAVERFLQQETDYHRRVLAAATGALTADQVNALQQSFEQFAQMQKFGVKMSREMFKPAAAPAPPAPPTDVAK